MFGNLRRPTRPRVTVLQLLQTLLRLLHGRKVLRVLTRATSVGLHLVTGRGRLTSLRLAAFRNVADSPSLEPPLAVAVCHVYYPSLFNEMLSACRRAPWVNRVLVTCPYEHQATLLGLLHTESVEASDLLVRVTPVMNFGRDVVPFLGLLHHPWLREADLVLKIHTKRSPHLPIGKGEYWRTSLLQGLAPVDGRRRLGLQRVLCQAAASRHPKVLWPIRWAYSIESWGANRAIPLQIEPRISPAVTLPLLFPAGTMFWCNQPFLGELRTSLASATQSWPLGEDTTLDGGMVHAVERFIGVLASRKRAITVTW